MLVDSFTPMGAWSCRKVSSGYAGDCLRLRRTSDDVEADIGFVDGLLDIASAQSFCGANDGRVVTWYDQSGNGYDLAQSVSASQPVLLLSGQPVLFRSVPAVSFAGGDYYLHTSGMSVALPNTVSVLAKNDSVASYQHPAACQFGYSAAGNGAAGLGHYHPLAFDGGLYWQGPFARIGGNVSSFPSSLSTTQRFGEVFGAIHTSAGGSAWSNGVSGFSYSASTVSGSGNFIIGARWNTSGSGVTTANPHTWRGPIAEIAVWGSDKTSDMPSIQKEMAIYPSVFSGGGGGASGFSLSRLVNMGG